MLSAHAIMGVKSVGKKDRESVGGIHMENVSALSQYANQKSNELERNMKKLIIAWW